MKAILINADQSLRWGDVPDPIMQPDECLVKIHAAGVNRADLMQRAGDYPPPPGCPEWMGLEVSGTIAQIGAQTAQSSRWQVGDKVCALLGGGGYAEYVTVKHDMLMPVPQGCTMVEAAALPEACATAYLNLFTEGGLQPGDTLLVTGGNSGLSSIMIPMAKAFGARVIATARGAHKCAAVSRFGADVVIDTTCEHLPAALHRELDAGHGVDVAIDCLGGGVMGECLPHLNRGARWIMIAALAGQLTQIDLKNIYVRGIRVIGSTLRSRPPAFKAHLLSELVENVWPHVTAGDIRPTIHAVLPITRAEQAQALLSGGQSMGKVVLVI